MRRALARLGPLGLEAARATAAEYAAAEALPSASKRCAPAAAAATASRCCGLHAHQQQRHLLPHRHAFSSYTGPSSSSVSTAPRRVPQKGSRGSGGGGGGGGGGGAAAADGSAAGGSGAAASPGASPHIMAMTREVPGGTKPMQSWERWYWGAGVGAVALWLSWRLKPDSRTPETIEDEKQKAAELEVKRRDHLRAVLASQRHGGFIGEGEDPLNGLTPRQIEEFMGEAGIDPRDPLEVGAAGLLLWAPGQWVAGLLGRYTYVVVMCVALRIVALCGTAASWLLGCIGACSRHHPSTTPTT